MQGSMMLVKRYSNRRLYDTQESRYITLQDLAEKIRQGADPRVVDAKTGDDLTQATLAQIIIESRGAARMLPVPLLVQLIRLGDASLAEFFGRYMSVALELYLHAKRGAESLSQYAPLATVPFDAASAFARMFLGVFPTREATGVSLAAGEGADPEVAALRKEVDELKETMRRQGMR